MDRPLLLWAAERGAFGGLRRFERGSIADAQNAASRHLAEKFGFEAEQEYPVYWVEAGQCYTKFHLIHAHLRASFPPWLCFASVNDALHRLPPLSFARTKNPLRICTCFRRNLV